MTTRLIPIYIVLFSTLVFGCKKEAQKPQIDYPVYNDTIPHMIPSQVVYPELTTDFKTKAVNRLTVFANKNWGQNNHYSFLVVKNGEILFEKYQGYIDIPKKTPITSDTPIHIASVSKVLTATAVMLLVNAKKLQLDQKVCDVLPKFPYLDVTIKDLLTHRSGIRNYAYFTEEKGVWDRKKVLTNNDLLTILKTKNIKQDCPANRRFCYCNTNYALLALVIEKISGTDYKDAMKRMIFEPLGMKNTFVFNEAIDKSKVSKTYKGSNIEIGFDYLDAIYGDKNIYSTPRDLMRFDLARNAPTFLTDALRKQIFDGYSNERKGTKNYGLGMRMINFENGENYYFHNGWWHGNTSSYICLQKEHVAIITLSNKYTTLTYRTRNLAPFFGNYPFVIKDSLAP